MGKMRVNRDARKRLQLEKKQAERLRRMIQPSGKSVYAKKVELRRKNGTPCAIPQPTALPKPTLERRPISPPPHTTWGRYSRVESMYRSLRY